MNCYKAHMYTRAKRLNEERREYDGISEREKERAEVPLQSTFPEVAMSIGCVSLGVFLLFFSSCGPQTGKLTLTGADKDKTFQVHVGDQITIQLDENPSTGYLWAIDKTDDGVLALQSSDYTPTPGGAIGSGGTRVFTFVAKDAGTVHLQLKLWRSFVGDSSIIQRYAVTIQVQS